MVSFQAAIATFAQSVHAAAATDFWGAAGLFLLGMTVSCALSVPVAPYLAVAAGWIFGWFPAMVLVLTAASFGAALAVVILRTVLKPKVNALLERFPDAEKARGRFEAEGLWYVFLSRLLIFIPYVLVNALAAVTGIPVLGFTAATAVGLIPWAAFYCYVGTGIRAFESGGWEIPWQWGATLAGGAVLLWVLRRAVRAG